MSAPDGDTIASGRRSGVPAHDQLEGASARPMIRTRGLGRSFGERTVLAGVDVDLAAGGFLLVTGANGSGKTTLLRLLAGLLAPTAGTVEVDSERARLGFVGHEPFLYGELTALENLDLYGRLYRVPERRERIGMLLERFGLWAARAEPVATFSRGMVQRLSLCRALLHEPDLLLLDEPYSALDDEGAALLDGELAAAASTKTLVVSTHDPGRVDRLATDRLTLA
jgi:heme exporter protein A